TDAPSRPVNKGFGALIVNLLGIVPQGMGCNRFGNTATSMRLLARPLYRVPADVALHSIAREEPFLGLFQWPPVAEHLEQLWGEHDIAIFAPLCCLPTYVALDS